MSSAARPLQSVCLSCRLRLLAAATSRRSPALSRARNVTTAAAKPTSAVWRPPKKHPVRTYATESANTPSASTERNSSHDTSRNPQRHAQLDAETQESLDSTLLPNEAYPETSSDSPNFQRPIRPTDPDSLTYIARRARETFGETLPENFLTPEEYAVYERLYGPPIRATRREDVRLLQGFEDGEGEEYGVEEGEGEGEEDGEGVQRLFKDGVDGLEEVEYEGLDSGEVEGEEVGVEEVEEGAGRRRRDVGDSEGDRQLFADMQAQMAALNTEQAGEESDGWVPEEIDDAEPAMRSHPLTVAGRFATNPSTLYLPRSALTDPTAALLAETNSKHLKDTANRVFGGVGLPYSTATPGIGRTMPQKPIGLDATQAKMSEMEGDAFLGALWPGMYASVMSTLVEVRKRLGSSWLEGLINQQGGPRILDAGAGGAGVIAWREVLRAEWARIHNGAAPEDVPIPQGRATVLTGSSALRDRAACFLDSTTFIPRLPDYINPSAEQSKQPRKVYDIIIAPHTLWPLNEEYLRRQQVQNLWSLLDPKGGVLILIEKGLPRGFEAIAAARAQLLDNHIASPELELEQQTELLTGRREKESGMIIAPCTNHEQCPMYTIPGLSQGRKDFCHFEQRFIRPPYLQRILGAKDRNHDDVSFSYVAVRRGVDNRRTDGLVQGERATTEAFKGHEDALDYAHPSAADTTALPADAQTPSSHDPQPQSLSPSTLSLPRIILPTMKRRGHVILDLCTPAGKLERWTVPRSFSKQAFRDARKSSWGDLWGLGAKTRVERTARLGRKHLETNEDLGEGGNERGKGYYAGLGAFVEGSKGQDGRADGEDAPFVNVRSGRRQKGIRDKRDRKSGIKQRGFVEGFA